ncbi:MAG: arginine repressor [Clostridia bacterium]|nr:arginine repressor [Clostridia bacterium]
MKNKRHEMIARLIAEYDIETQEELAARLSENGFAVTQATVSRDIKQMRLIKTQNENGVCRYSTVKDAEADMQDRFTQIFANCVLSVEGAGNLIVIKTITGSASAAAEAVDSLKWQEIIGTIAGDNTIFLAVRDPEAVAELIAKFRTMLR